MDHACDRCGPILTGSNKLVQDTFACFEIRRIEASLIRRFCQRLIAVFLAVSLRFSGVSREALALSVPVPARSGRPSRNAAVQRAYFRLHVAREGARQSASLV